MDQPETSPDLLLEDRFAIVPEWLLDADISDAAVRLYAVLLRYGQSSGARMPSRSTLARRIHKRSTDSVDRAMKDLIRVGAVRIEHRYDGGQRLTNAYHVRTSRPAQTEMPPPPDAGSRTPAATPALRVTAGRKDAARVAADPRHDPEHLTESTTSSPSSAVRGSGQTPNAHQVASRCGIEDWPAFVEEIRRMRHQLGASSARWASSCLATALQSATEVRGWPAAHAADSLRRVAADPKSRSPMRVAEAGPWWDEPPARADAENLRAKEQALLEVGGLRIDLQSRARRALEDAGLPVTRPAVVERAYQLLQEHQARGAAS